MDDDEKDVLDNTEWSSAFPVQPATARFRCLVWPPTAPEPSSVAPSIGALDGSGIVETNLSLMSLLKARE